MEKYKPSHEDLKFGSESYQQIVLKSHGLLYTKYVNRNLAWLFTRFLYRFSPNAISTFAFIFLVLGLFFIELRPTLTSSIVIYFILTINFILDSTDGQVARLTKQGTPLGEWLDHSLDAIRLLVVNAFLVNYITSYSDFSGNIVLLFLPLTGLIGLFVVGELRNKILTSDPSETLRKSKNISMLSTLILFPVDYGVFILIFFLLPFPSLLVSVYILLGIYYSFILLVNMLVIYISEKNNAKI